MNPDPGTFSPRCPNKIVVMYIRLTSAASVHQQVLHVFESTQVDFQLRIAPTGHLPDIFAAKAIVFGIDLLLIALGADPVCDQLQQLTALRW